eukprot:1137672-Pelagomonas_calceolata.AAC.4
MSTDEAPGGGEDNGGIGGGSKGELRGGQAMTVETDSSSSKQQHLDNVHVIWMGLFRFKGLTNVKSMVHVLQQRWTTPPKQTGVFYMLNALDAPNLGHFILVRKRPGTRQSQVWGTLPTQTRREPYFSTTKFPSPVTYCTK